jgi:hypothetical protein
MILDIAGPRDNTELLEFFKEFPSKGWVEFKLDRREDYSAIYRLHSDQYQTYILRDRSHRIQATASFAFRDVIQDGVVQKIALATDLRVSPQRNAILQWSQHFLPVMEKITQEFKISQFFSVINLTEPAGLNLFVRPRTMKRPLPRYYLYRKFNLTTLHGKFPWAASPLPHVKIRKANEQNLEALLAYILKRSKYRPFASVWDLESLKNKIGRMPGFQISDFLIAVDANENVIGCLAPWLPEGIQDWIPRSYSLRAHNFRQFLKFGKILGWTRTLSKPIRSTGLEAPLKFKYLTHIHVDNEDIFESLLNYAFDSAAADEFLVYAQVQQDIRLLPPENWITTQIPHAIYAVIPPHQEPPGFLHPSISLNPEIEAYLI